MPDPNYDKAHDLACVRTSSSHSYTMYSGTPVRGHHFGAMDSYNAANMNAITDSVQRMTVEDDECAASSPRRSGCIDSCNQRRQIASQPTKNTTKSATGHTGPTQASSSVDTLICAMEDTSFQDLDLPLAFYINIYLRLANTAADIAKPQLIFGSWSWAATFADLWSWTLACYADDGARDLRDTISIDNPIGVAFQLEGDQFRARCAAGDFNLESRYQAFLAAAEVAGEQRRREMIRARIEGTVDLEVNCYCFEAAVSGSVVVYYENEGQVMQDWGQRWDVAFEKSGLPF